MAILKSSLLVIAFVFFLCFIMSTGDGSYDYFQLVQHWPPTTCNLSRKNRSNHRPLPIFTIHGLWPSNYSNPRTPSNCTGSQFENLSPRLRSLLKISWPDVENGNDTSFWEHEWNKHGTCSEQKLNQDQYFERSHEMWRSYNITNILKNAQIVPSATLRWNYADIVSPIKTATGRTPLLRCKPDPQQPKGQANKGQHQGQTKPHQLLHEVVFCYESKAKKQIDCNRTGCRHQVDILLR